MPGIILLSFLFWLSCYFFFFGGYILFFQEQQSLFLYTASYLNDFFVKPGGLLDLSGRFLTQFYISKFAGSIILAVILTIPAIILAYINRRLIPGSAFSVFLLLMPSCLLLLMQTHYYHLMMYNLGFLLVLIYFLLWVCNREKNIKIPVTGIFPLILLHYWCLCGDIHLFINFVQPVVYKRSPEVLLPAFSVVVCRNFSNNF